MKNYGLLPNYSADVRRYTHTHTRNCTSTERRVILTVYPDCVIHHASCVRGCCRQAFTSLGRRPPSACLTWWPSTPNGLQHVSYPPRESCSPVQTNSTSLCSQERRPRRVFSLLSVKHEKITFFYSFFFFFHLK